jgi:transcriptional regulator with XRE-family HTH domain
MTMAVKENRRAMPAKKPVEQTSYNGRFAENLRTLRAGRDVDKILAAIERAGFSRCSKATYYNWEGGVTDPPIAALPALAKALGVSVPELFPAK